jgi:hypothetical protein
MYTFTGAAYIFAFQKIPFKASAVLSIASSLTESNSLNVETVYSTT